MSIKSAKIGILLKVIGWEKSTDEALCDCGYECQEPLSPDEQAEVLQNDQIAAAHYILSCGHGYIVSESALEKAFEGLSMPANKKYLEILLSGRGILVQFHSRRQGKCKFAYRIIFQDKKPQSYEKAMERPSIKRIC